MCGISIIINKNNTPVLPATIRAMNDKVVHRGPDDEGYYYKDSFAFGHRRLSVIDTSSAGHQPMEKSHDCIVFNGMIYNYIELRDELASAGFTFTSKTDTEVILAAWQYWKTDAFRKMNGMWAIAIHDVSMQQIIFCRDHFGIKPLYYTHNNQFFAAASEIKQFTVLPGFTPVLNINTTLQFLANGSLNYSDETFFKDVQALSPGHFIRYSLVSHTATVHRWYHLHDTIKPNNDSIEQATATVYELFNSAVKMRMRSDVKVGSCLSGGIDSSAIVSTVHAQQSFNSYFTTFTSCYTDNKYDEQPYSEAVTTQTGFPAVKIFPDLQQLLEAGDFDTMIYHQDQPVNSASHYSEFAVFRAAQLHKMTVMLDGQGSDEYLCGYPEFFLTYIRELLNSGRVVTAFRAIRSKGRNGQGTMSLVKELVKVGYGYPFIHLTKRVLGKSQYAFLTKESIKQLAQRPGVKEAITVRQLTLQQLQHTSIPYQLHSEDRNSMLFSIESRLPFLDHRLVEYITSLPAHYKIDHGYTKYILRQAITALPNKVRWRKDKLGFAAPDREWILANQVAVRKELEMAIRSTPFFSDALLQRFDLFIAGRLGYEPVYFRAMALHRFCKIFKMQMPGQV